MLRKLGIEPQTSSIDLVTEDHVSKFIATLKKQLPGTEQVYIVDIKNFYKFLGADNIKQFNYPRIETIIKMRKRKPPVRLPQFPEADMSEFLDKIDNIIYPEHPFENTNEKLRAYRDRAFMMTLADTGMRVGEACSLLVGSVDRKSRKVVLLGKNNEEAVVRFSPYCIEAINDYLAQRYEFDLKTGRQRSSLPLFMRHDNGAKRNNITLMGTSTALRFVKARILEVLKHHPEISVTPHSFRHYFGTIAYRITGDIRKTQSLLRHKKMETTRIYTHLDDKELDDAYNQIVAERRKRNR
jgi:integrase/recombinase XerC/integrase/recombinase XerD